MPVEFALRPRIRLREDPAPVRRVRARLPKFALPALAYWLATGGLVYGFVRHHQPPGLPEQAEVALAQPATQAPALRQWWRPLPAPPAAPQPSEPTPEVEPAPASGSSAPLAELPTEPVAQPTSAAPGSANEALPALTPPSAIAELGSSDSHGSHDSSDSSDSRDSERSLDLSRARAHRPTRTSPLADTDRPGAHRLLLAPPPAPTFGLPDAPAPAPTPAPTVNPEPPRSAASGLPSCEAAAANASQDVDFAGNGRVADLPTQAIAAVLENGAWLGNCPLPEHTALDVCVAIKGGRVVGVSVASRPVDAALNSCVKRRASSLQFPYSPHLDIARTRF